MEQPRSYRPLIVLVAITVAAAYAIAPFAHSFLSIFMGLFLCVFAMLKLFNPDKFADGFAMYDLLGKRVRAWGYVYPYVELALGLLYLARVAPEFTAIVTIIVFAFGAAGTALALRRGLDINCPCMGNVLNVPLSTVTLTEDMAMILMAIFMLV